MLKIEIEKLRKNNNDDIQYNTYSKYTTNLFIYLLIY